jgi:hypothetical protein
MKQLYKLSLVVVCLFFCFTICKAQVTLNADGPGNTYELINSVLAPGYNAMEAPDLIHPGFGRHIAEVFDAGLNKNVFEFYSHLTPDNEPNNPLLTDRQRVEIKTYDQSPANLIGTTGEYITYKWRFKIPVGFQPSSNFTHLHQIKPVGGDDGDPLFTLTARKGTPNKLELIYVPDMSSSQDKKQTVNLSSFEGVWVEVTEKVLVGASGSYAISIKRVTDNAILMAYTNTNIATIRPDNTFIRPKWGIYRSILSPGDLRDEAVRFSDFSITEGFTTFGAQTYFWTGNLGITSFSASSNWNTALDGSGTARPAIPATDDVLIIDGTNVGGNIFPSVTGPIIVTISGTTGNTFGQLKLQNNADISMQRPAAGAGTGTLNINGDGTSDPDFTIPAGSILKLNSPLADGSVVVNLTNPATGLIGGTITLSNTGLHRITSLTVNGLVFASGATFNSAGTPATATYPFGSGTQGVQNGVVFQAGSNLVVTGTRSPLAGTSTFQSCILMTGSNTYFKTNASSATGSYSNLKTYGNLFIQNNSTFTSDGPFYKIDSLTIDAGSTLITHSSGSTPVFGNLLVNGTLSAPGASTNVLVMGGNVPQTVSGTGSIIVPNLVVANASDVSFAKSISVGTSTNIFGKINLGATSQITGAGTFSTKTQTIPTPATVTGNLVVDSFVVRGVPLSPALSGINGLKVTGAGIAPNTNVVGFSASSGTINLSKPATASGIAVSLTFSSDSATIATSNVNGLDSLTGGVVVIGNKSYATGTSYIINGATTKPIGISSGNNTNMQVGDLTINAATTLNYNTRVRGTLTMNAGNFTLRPLDTMRITSGNDIAGAPFSASKYIVSGRAGNNLGVLRMDNFTTAKTFPIGTATNYLPVTLTPTAAMSYAVSVFEGATVDGTPAGALVSAATKDESVDAEWIINRTLGSGDCAVQLNWTTALEGTLFTAYPNINVGISRYDGAMYETSIGTGDNTTNMADASFMNFSPFIVTKKGTVLPLQFKSIEATAKQNSTEIKWNVESEDDVQSYIVEKSTDNRAYAAIGTVIASNSHSYTFNDASVSSNNIFYYRIKIIMLTGAVKYSNIVFVKQNNGNDVVVYPNPVKDVLSIAGLKGNTSLKLINANGQIVLQQNTTASSLTIEMQNIKPGIYMLQVYRDGNKQMSKTIIKE